MNLNQSSFFKAIFTFLLVGMAVASSYGQNQDFKNLPKEDLRAKGQVSFPATEVLRDKVLLGIEATAGDDLGGSVTVDAQWDQQFQFPIPGGTGNTGVFWTGTEFWVSRFNSDTLLRISPTGALLEKFLIPGVSGVISITTDGTSLFMANYSDTIVQVNPITRTVTGSIIITGTAPTALALTYDPTLNAGAGGFYTADFTSPIGIISKTGATLGTIPQATHGREGIIGLAFDPISTGGPYLWVFEQAGSPSDAVISQVSLPSGAWTGVSFDVAGDLGLPPTIPAGGLFLAPNIVTGQNTIGGLLQGNPGRIFGYELDFVPVQFDAAVSAVLPTPGFSIVPKNQVEPITIGGSIRNLGQQSVSSAVVSVEVSNFADGSIAFTGSDAVGVLPPISAGTSETFSVGPWTPVADTGAYLVTVTSSTGAQIDENTANDSAFFALFVSDSTLARDQGPITGLLGVGPSGGQNKLVAQSYSIKETDFLTSVSLAFGSPTANTQVFASIFPSNPAGGPAATPIANSEAYTFTQADDDNGVFITLAFTTPQPLPGGQTFYVGVHETTAENIGMAATTSILTPGTLWFRGSAIQNGQWQQAVNPVVLVIRPNFGICTPTRVTATINIDDDDSGNNDATLSVSATGGSGSYTYLWNDPAGSTTPVISNVAGNRTYSVIVTDTEGCTVTLTSDIVNVWTTSIEDQLPQGVSVFKAYPNPVQGEFFAEVELDQVQNVTMSLLDNNGRMIFAKELKSVSSVRESVNMAGYPAGIYLLQLTTGEGTATRKVTVE